MKPSPPKTEPPPSTQFRNAVFRGSLGLNKPKTMPHSSSSIRIGLAGLLCCAGILGTSSLAAADDSVSAATIHSPLRLPPDPIPCERIALGEPDDYKPCIARMPDGELLLTAFHPHKREGGKVMEQMLLFRSKDGGKTWSQPEKLDLLGREPYLTVLPDGTIFITVHLLAQDVRNRWGYTCGFLHRSTDRGRTWESIRVESEGIKPKASNHTTRNVLRLADGTLLLGVDYDGGGGPYLIWRSTDNGKTWDKTQRCVPKDFQSKYGFFGGETWLWQANSGTIWALVRVDSTELPIQGRPIKAKSDQADHFILFSSADGAKTFDRIRDFGDYGEMYMSLLRLKDSRLLLTFTVRDLNPPLGVRAIPGIETKDGFTFDFAHDRVMLDTKTGSRYQGGGFSPTVQLDDGTLVTACSYRGEDKLTHLEVIRWKLPASPKAVETPRPVVKVVQGGESKARPEDCRATLVGPGINQPDPFPGYGGFVGWVSPVRLKNGDWLVGFSAGYWHASAPTPLRFSPETIASYHKIGLPPDIVAPTGGRAMITRSTDEGKTWSKPVTILDTPDDDRHPAFVETRDGTLLCSVFTYPGADRADHVKHPELAHRTAIIRSFDHGKTWDKEIIRLPSPFRSDETNGPMVLLQDGSVLLTVSGAPNEGGPTQAAVFTSKDSGATWQFLSTIKAGNHLQEVIVSTAIDTVQSRVMAKEHDLHEANATVLPDGQWVMMARAEGDICWSRDQGRTWTAPVSFGMRMYAPSLYVLRDGTLVCLHGSYVKGALRVIFSTDGGHTWIAPAKDYGFLVSRCYGYGKAMELPDGSLLVTEQGGGGHTTRDAQNMSIRCLRLRIRADHSGIDLLPAPNR